MASLNYKPNGTPYVDFRVNGRRYRPEFENIKDANNFYKMACVDPLEAYHFWIESQKPEGSSGIVSLKEKIEAFKDDYCSRRSRPKEMGRHVDRLFDFILEMESKKQGRRREDEFQRDKVTDLDISAVTADHLCAYQSFLMKKGLANSSINREFATIKTFFKRANKAGLITLNPADLVESLCVKQVQRVAWSDESTGKLINLLTKSGDDQVLIDIVESMEFTPFGPIDFERLLWSNINFDIGEINTFRMKGKGRREWDVPLLLGYQKILLRIKQRHEAAGFGKPNDHVYLDKNWRPIQHSWVSKYLERRRKAAGIKEVPYSSRHRILSEIADRVGRDAASRFAGHASVRTTEKFYLVGGKEEFREKIAKAMNDGH